MALCTLRRRKSEDSLRGKCFRAIGEQRKTKERFGVLPAREWGESQNEKDQEWGGGNSLLLNPTETLVT